MLESCQASEANETRDSSRIPSLRRHLRMRQHVRDPFDRRRVAGRGMLELPSLLYRHSAPGGHRRPDRAVQSQVRSQSSIATSAARGAHDASGRAGDRFLTARSVRDSVTALFLCAADAMGQADGGSVLDDARLVRSSAAAVFLSATDAMGQADGGSVLDDARLVRSSAAGVFLSAADAMGQADRGSVLDDARLVRSSVAAVFLSATACALPRLTVQDAR